MPDIRASAEVKALIGAENLRELERDSFAWYDCPECGEQGGTANPSSVVVYRYRDIALVKLAHASCLPSTIVDIDGDAPAGIGLEAGRRDMRAMTVVLECSNEPALRPVLLLEPRVETATLSAGGERTNLILAALLRRGLTLMRTPDQMPRPAPGWWLRCSDNETALLVSGEGDVVYSGGCDQTRAWAGLTDAAQACVVLIGSIGLYALSDEELSTGRLRQALDGAARSGGLVGGLVSCQRGDFSGSVQAPWPVDLDSRARRVWGSFRTGGGAQESDP